MKKNILLLFLIVFSGCSIKTLPPVKKYSIEKNINIKKFKNDKCNTINIAFMQSSDILMSKNMIYSKGLEKNSYYFSEWFQVPSVMLTNLIYQTMKDSDICKDVYYQMPSFQTDYTLHSKLLEFDQRFDDTKSYGIVDVLFYITDKKNHIIAQKEFSVVSKATSNNAIGGVKAINKASNILIKKVICWIFKSIQNQQP